VGSVLIESRDRWRNAMKLGRSVRNESAIGILAGLLRLRKKKEDCGVSVTPSPLSRLGAQTGPVRRFEA